MDNASTPNDYSLEETSKRSMSDSVAQPISSSEASLASIDDTDVLNFGPIRVKRRTKPAPTLATGRRSKYETLIPEQEEKRALRRARNRAAADRVRLNRLGIEHDLQTQMNQLEEKKQQLQNEIQMLQNKRDGLKLHLHTHQTLCTTVIDCDEIPADFFSTYTSQNFPNTNTSQQVDRMANLHLNDFDGQSAPISSSLSTFPEDDDNLDLLFF